jgi:mevalonate kinase
VRLWRYSTLGKLILFGENSVIYDRSSIVVAVNIHCRGIVSKTKRKTVKMGTSISTDIQTTNMEFSSFAL